MNILDYRSKNALPDGAALFVGLARLGIDHYFIKNSKLPPAMFRNLDGMKHWARENGFIVEKLGKFSEDNCLLVRDRMHQYESLWVRKEFQGYRGVMKAFARKGFIARKVITENGIVARTPPQSEIDKFEEVIAKIDADHVVARVRLGSFPGCWIMLTPVGVGSNRSHGASFEKNLPCIASSTDVVYLEPYMILKIYLFGSLPTTATEKDQAMKIVSGQMLGSHEKEELFEAIQQII